MKCRCTNPMIKCDDKGCHCTTCGGLSSSLDQIKENDMTRSSQALPFNQLNNSEHERLAMLFEEAGEIVQAVGKIMRHGYNSFHPKDTSTNNRELLEKELGDLIGVMYAMVTAGDLQLKNIVAHANAKWDKAYQYTHHQGPLVSSLRWKDSDHPEGFEWINEPVTVRGEDFTYQGQLLLSFPKWDAGPVPSGMPKQIRYVVRDQNNRLFIQNGKQIGREK